MFIAYIIMILLILLNLLIIIQKRIVSIYYTIGKIACGLARNRGMNGTIRS